MNSILITKPLRAEDIIYLAQRQMSYAVIPALKSEFQFDSERVGSYIQEEKVAWIFTSQNAVLSLSVILEDHARKKKQEIYVVGNRAHDLLKGLGYQKIDISINAKELVAKLETKRNFKSIYFHGKHVRKELPDFLNRQMTDHKLIEVYQTKKINPFIKEKQFDAIFYFSPLSVKSILKENKWIKSIAAIAVGPTTALALKEYGFKNIMTAAHTNLKSMIEVVEKNILAV